MQGVECYKKIENSNSQELFVKKYSPMIKKIANHINKNTPESIELDDLLQSGLIGLLEAKKSYNSEAGASFSTYATLKIRYAIYEYIRKASGITRDISQNIKKMENAIQTLGSQASDTRVAEQLGVSQQKYSDMLRQINTYKAASVHASDDITQIPGNQSDDPVHVLEISNLKTEIKNLLIALPKREQIIFALHYNEHATFKQIADILDLTEARISQIHTQTLLKLKKRIKQEI